MNNLNFPSSIKNQKTLGFADGPKPIERRSSSRSSQGGEHGPLFRSVSMSVPPAPRLLSASGDSYNLKAPTVTCSDTGTSDQGSNANLLPGIPAVPGIPGRVVLAKTPSRPSTPGMNLMTPRNEEFFAWTLDADSVPSIPMYHPLERSALTISDLSLDDITKRISDFLRDESMCARYSEARVEVSTIELVTFVVYLWKDPAGGVVIELQRRQGCCMAMQSYRQALAEAVTGTGRGEPAQVTPRSTCAMAQSLMAPCLASLPPPPSAADCTDSAIDISKRLLETDQLDSQRLGLESLRSMTNPMHARLGDCSRVALTILTCSEWQRLLAPYFARDGTNTDGAMQAALRFLALQVVSQAVEALTDHDPIQIPRNHFWNNVLETLYDFVLVASTKPLEAALSIRCLRHLHRLQPRVADRIPSLQDCMVQARNYGKLHNRTLQVETEAWMGGRGFVY